MNYALDGLAVHEAQSHVQFARQLAALMQAEFAGTYEASLPDSAFYFVPSRTLLLREARELGIASERDLYGGVVPARFVATKAISHGLIDPQADAPPGWQRELAGRVQNVVHRGFTAFSAEDARRITARLLPAGPIRFKPPLSRGGSDQEIVAQEADLERALEAIDETDIRECGLVLEENLSKVGTLSVGELRVDTLHVVYCGTQRLTANNHGDEVYGGSDLLLARGGFAALLPVVSDPNALLAIEQAREFDAAVNDCFPAMFASRRNYDVAQGEVRGQWRSGVLEQSWRVGGATGAELAGLAALQADPALGRVRASCHEVYGPLDAPRPPEAMVYFRGEDTRTGPITKYAVVHGEPGRGHRNRGG